MNDLRHVELLEDLSPYGTAKAALLRWNGEKYVRTDQVIELCEFLGTHGERRNRGFARFFEESDRWEAVSTMQEAAEIWMPL